LQGTLDLANHDHHRYNPYSCETAIGRLNAGQFNNGFPLEWISVMMRRFPCPYLKGVVDLTEERECHTAERHPDMLPQHRWRIAETLSHPDQIRGSARFAGAKLYSMWYDDLRGGKHVVVVVVSESERDRHWIVTAYIARRLSGGQIEWRRN
jgi:hypothetical protein